MKTLMHHPMHRRFSLWAAAVLACVALPVQAAGLCTAPWVHDGTRLRLDGNGKTPMIVEFTLHDVNHDIQDGCEIGLHIYAKSGLVALGGRPIETVQDHQLLVDEAGVVTRVVSINGHVFAQSEHADLVGTVSTAISGMFLYGAGLAPEAEMLPGDTYESSFDFDVVSPRLGISVGRMRAAHARVEVSERQVGPPQPMNTVVGILQCRPIRYTRTARLGVLRLGNETIEPDPTVAHLTDWYCPEAGVVMRQEVEQHGETQTIDVVDLQR
ncbi:hypothetical protein [Ralstonia mannitolilytica]|uniref:Uncharacterized protein n=1 Tax=Ralstonia mannitolilytica TaxID=105219 RepID=A0AAD2EI17_9RALS|nr:hypothetical protein [Ralstonia mannitolilytica]MBY4717830.1 hypothetical protein [Ralstonia mannitolilytica]CAJ0683584.1 hypothetical protein R77591_02329 [Ralstonia mannitolilytica]CAJ0709027.1 hypothetical protein LMG8323_00480 [Ralstonia mannitolilytica]CAJ0737817.1 hypothetical protein R76696_01662 [Ralstonia mannitolilytica]CAJ0787144.1 hypothetical protein LMG18090_02076 [Ralstonia mannitolilytica]